jgi:hypothetical protein
MGGKPGRTLLQNMENQETAGQCSTLSSICISSLLRLTFRLAIISLVLIREYNSKIRKPGMEN